eukprot:5181780-Prymnesium_polylepis.1
MEELALDPPAADASASTGASEPTPMHEEMEPLSDMELEDMTDVDDQSAAGNSDHAMSSGGGNAPG